MVTLLPMHEFLSSFGRAMNVRMNLSPYYGHSYECACGQTHPVEFYSELLCQGYWRVITVCPNDSNYLTNIKIRRIFIFKFLGFQSLNGTYIELPADKLLLTQVLAELL